MTQSKVIVLAAGVVLFSILYFGFSTKPQKMIQVESNRVITSTKLDINNLIRDAQSDISNADRTYLITLEKELEETESESEQIALLKNLSGKWYATGNPHIAGFYAEKVAEIENTSEAWSITGTTYATTFQMNKPEKLKEYARTNAVQAFENAISIAPDDVRLKINLALCYVEYPLSDNPMKGIMMLLDLNKNNPDNPLILNNLGRLAIQTGQYDKAIERLERVLEIDSENVRANCLLAQVYGELNNLEKKDFYIKRCKEQ